MDEALKVGDVVLVFDVNGKRLGMDPNGQPQKVLKVGRKLVTLEGRWGRPETYRIEDGVRNDNYEHSWFRTQTPPRGCRRAERTRPRNLVPREVEH